MNIEEFTNTISNGKQVLFVKYGDGEINCMLGYNGSNCDGDPYTKNLSQGLLHSLVFFSSNQNVLVGKWHGVEGYEKLQYIITTLNIQQPNYTDYHLVYNDANALTNNKLYNFVKAVKKSSYTKILFTNSSNKLLMKLFNGDIFIEVPSTNWFLNFSTILETIKEKIINNCILLTAGGMGSKVLTAEILKINPTVSCIDIGSSFDLLCQKKYTRDYKYTYDDIYNYYKELL